eukprot:IDg4515t1
MYSRTRAKYYRSIAQYSRTRTKYSCTNAICSRSRPKHSCPYYEHSRLAAGLVNLRKLCCNQSPYTLMAAFIFPT